MKVLKQIIVGSHCYGSLFSFNNKQMGAARDVVPVFVAPSAGAGWDGRLSGAGGPDPTRPFVTLPTMGGGCLAALGADLAPEGGAAGEGRVDLVAVPGPAPGLPGAGGAALPLNLGVVALPLTAGDFAAAGGGGAVLAPPVAARKDPAGAGASSEPRLPSVLAPPGAVAGALAAAGGGAAAREGAAGPPRPIGAETEQQRH